MRAAPALSISIDLAQPWRIGVLVLCAAAALVVGLWLSGLRASPESGAVWLIGVVAGGVVLAAASTARGGTLQLRWDGRDWHLRRGGQEHTGTLVLCLDLGGGWLLRFQPLAQPAPWHAVWLPVSAAALGGRAHALRCALYSPRLSAGSPGQLPASDV